MIGRYARWLHGGWPAGAVEPFPRVEPDGRTNVPGVYVVGDLVGVPLLKFALQTGTAAARAIASDPRLRADGSPDLLDVVIVGGGVAGMAAAVEARALGLRFEILEASEPFSTLVHFPRRKPIYTYPRAMVPIGALRVSADVKEALVEELQRQVSVAGIQPRAERVSGLSRGAAGFLVHLENGPDLVARRVIVAVGRSGDHRRLQVPGEDLDKVTNRLHDPRDFAGQDALVVGGGDAACETAIALAESGARVVLSHRDAELSRPKPENLRRIERLVAERKDFEVAAGTRVRAILPDRVTLETSDGEARSIHNDVVFTMIGRRPPLEFLRRCGIRIAGERGLASWIGLAALLLFCAWLYDWKSGGTMAALWQRHDWFPMNLPELLSALGGSLARAAADPRTLVGTLAIGASSPSFWYTLAYSIVIVVFGVKRIRRRRTPYVTAQTVTLMAIQVLPLFLVPEIVLPLLHHNGWLPRGLADALFPAVTHGHGREFWRAYGLILAWPLNVYNAFTPQPLPWWIAIGAVQTFVLIPLAVYFYGKGAYCGWICSCGALAETLGDTHRHKMPHGRGWNRLNLAGQGILAIALLLLALRIAGWMLPEGNAIAARFDGWKEHYKWTVDVFLAGVLGYGLYFHFSGRVWCRFFCPLAALMHVYARLGRFAIVPEKKKCISCELCTSVCHQGIDVMRFANRGLPMIDPQCVRCSACVQVCPTGVLQFGQVRRDGTLISVDSLAASPVRMREGA